MTQPSITEISLGIIHMQVRPNTPGANELISLGHATNSWYLPENCFDHSFLEKNVRLETAQPKIQND